MNFKDATDGLFDRISHEELADALGVSVASIRQARLGPQAKAYRAPPPNWQDGAIKLAEKRAVRYKRLASRLRLSTRKTASTQAIEIKGKSRLGRA